MARAVIDRALAPMSAESGPKRGRASAPRPPPSLEGIVACLDLLALEALEAGNLAVAQLLREAAGRVRILIELDTIPRHLS